MRNPMENFHLRDCYVAQWDHQHKCIPGAGREAWQVLLTFACVLYSRTLVFEISLSSWTISRSLMEMVQHDRLVYKLLMYHLWRPAHFACCMWRKRQALLCYFVISPSVVQPHWVVWVLAHWVLMLRAHPCLKQGDTNSFQNACTLYMCMYIAGINIIYTFLCACNYLDCIVVSMSVPNGVF